LKFRIGIILLIFFMNPTVVQSGVNTDFQTWLDITTIYDWGRWKYNGDQGIRGVLSGNDFNILYVRPSVLYRVKPWFTVHGGIGFFQSFIEDLANISELRPWQGLRFVWPRIGGYVFHHFLRLEERMFWHSGQGNSSDFILRSRYQLGFRSPTWDILLKNGIFLKGSIELFWDLEDSFFDKIVNRIRYDLGVGTYFSRAWRVELHYVLQDGRAIEQAFQNPFRSEEHILRLRLFYEF